MPSQGDVPLAPDSCSCEDLCTVGLWQVLPRGGPSPCVWLQGPQGSPSVAYSASCQVSREVAERSTRVTVIRRSRPAQPGSEAAAMSEAPVKSGLL